MLIGRHRARIDIQIGIELPDTDAVAARLQQSREASRHQTFAKRGDHAAGDKNEPRHGRKDLLNGRGTAQAVERSEEHTSELQSLMRISYAVFCLKKKKTQISTDRLHTHIITSISQITKLLN